MHHVDIRGTSHQPNPDEKRTKNIQTLNPHVLCVQKHEDEIDSLQHGQDPNSLDLDVLERASADEDSDLVACVEDNEELLYADIFSSIWVESFHLTHHSICETTYNAILKKVDGE